MQVLNKKKKKENLVQTLRANETKSLKLFDCNQSIGT